MDIFHVISIINWTRHSSSCCYCCCCFLALLLHQCCNFFLYFATEIHINLRKISQLKHINTILYTEWNLKYNLHFYTFRFALNTCNLLIIDIEFYFVAHITSRFRVAFIFISLPIYFDETALSNKITQFAKCSRVKFIRIENVYFV